MPGVGEIKSCIEALRQRVRNVEIFPLHANLSNAEQKQVFAKTKRRKVVVATNVAETSVTIADIVYVIDSGKVKETQFDADTNMSRLVETYTRSAEIGYRALPVILADTHLTQPSRLSSAKRTSRTNEAGNLLQDLQSQN